VSVNVSSLTCYVLLAAIENDLRDLISSVASDEPPVDVLGADIYERALQRRRKDYPRSTSPHLASLLPYIDFSDAYTVLRGQASNLRPDLDVALKNFGSQWELLVGVRNRVAHSRPLELEDLPRVLDFSHELVNLPGAPWAATRHAQAELERNPGFVLGVTPSLIKDDESPIRHNLPPADFEETGFLGRKGQRRELLRALKGPWPVISILGDGGLGKTALALQVAYDLMDDSECPFEAIVWTSAKNATLTTSEILRVESAIEDSLGLFRGAASELGGEEALKNPVQELLDYLRTFPILLILDNLETVIDDRIRDFLRQLPHGSKVLITSRIGVGTENPFKLSPLSTAEAARLIRILARVRDVHPLRDLHDGEVEDLVTRMKCHPAFIKWFVSGVQAGQAPERLVEENGLLLDYCMSNVFDYLSEDACAVLRSMIVLPGTHTIAELAFLNKYSAASIQSEVLK
jgi:LuxR family transcriptional regulator, glucitol operon activator